MDDLLTLAASAEKLADAARASQVFKQLEGLADACNELAKAWSGSPLGYHADIYTEDLRPPGAEDMFSQEWGLSDAYSNPTTGYRRFDPDAVRKEILRRASGPDLRAARKSLGELADSFEELRSSLASMLTLELDVAADPFLKSKLSQAEEIDRITEDGWVQHLVPRGDMISRDSTAVGQGRKVAPHQQLLALPVAYSHVIDCLGLIATIARSAGSHVARKQKAAKKNALIGTNVFIGHGRSPLWRDLKDFFSERLKLPYDEFNRVPVAGVTNIVRLSEMLDAAAIAFIVMTAEDEMADGSKQARMNVIHEVGLFQGRLGFSRAIVLLEEGCEDFSNIDGLGQIRFPKGNIKAAFEEVRRVLEREGVIPTN